MPEYQHILYENRGPVVLITLNRPERLNAWTQTMENEFIDAINTASADRDTGCIVITGAGRGFCAGADIGGFNEGLQTRAEGKRPSKLLWEGGSPEVPITLSRGKPTICAVNGASVGVGLTFTLACDIRIASTAARFSARFVKVGLTPECGSTHYLPLVAGLPNALFMTLTGRIIDAQEALARGIVDRVVEPDATAAGGVQAGGGDRREPARRGVGGEAHDARARHGAGPAQGGDAGVVQHPRAPGRAGPQGGRHGVHREA